MSAPSCKYTVPEVLERFRSYHAGNPAWGSLHIVLDDMNLERHHVEYCRDAALERGDREGAALAEILLEMSPTQRRKLALKA